MDWNLALQRNQEILLRSVAWLFTWLKLEVGESVDELPEHQRRTVLFVLRPSESALRRLVVAAMLVLSVTAPPMVERLAQSTKRSERKSSGETRERKFVPSFKLIDPRKRFDLFPDRPKRVQGPGPRVTVFGWNDSYEDRREIYEYQEKLRRRKEQPISAKSVCNRMNAFMAAVQDLPGQALRLAKLQERMKRLYERTGKPNLSPLRPGLPPGYRQRHKHEVDEVLSECDWLARTALRELVPPDTS